MVIKKSLSEILNDLNNLPGSVKNVKNFPIIANIPIFGKYCPSLNDDSVGDNHGTKGPTDHVSNENEVLTGPRSNCVESLNIYLKIGCLLFCANYFSNYLFTNLISERRNINFGGDFRTTTSIKATLSKWYLRKVKGYDPYDEFCTIGAPSYFADLFRAPVNCEKCKNIIQVPKVSNLTPRQFVKEYAYSLQPVVITDAQQNWTANEVFGLDFFKQVYKPGSPVLEKSEKNCQFFPYKTEFKNLKQVFAMSQERAQLKDGSKPWYVGWSNCDSEAANTLRKYYTKPYFLPEESESSRTDWIFIGSPGYGAHMHIDHVGKPSWQAQIKGYKKWFLEPAPECYMICHNLEVVVGPGETIVLDTNKWYHQTLVIGDELSVVIGSEYD